MSVVQINVLCLAKYFFLSIISVSFLRSDCIDVESVLDNIVRMTISGNFL